MGRPVVLETTVSRANWYQTLGRLGLRWPSALFGDATVLLCAGVAPLTWAVIAWAIPVHSMSLVQIWSWGFVSVVIERGWVRPWVCGLSGANISVSLLFTVFHLWSHSPIWAVLVFFPSLVFGYLRDRFDSTVPSILMHMWYNGGYFFFLGSSQASTGSAIH